MNRALVALPPAAATLLYAIARNSDLDGDLPRNYDRQAFDSHFFRRPFTVLGRGITTISTVAPLFGIIVNHVKKDVLSSQPRDEESTGEPKVTKQSAQQFKQSLVDLGPAWVKFGQNLSIRPDLVPQIMIDELVTLCDAVPKFDDEDAMRVLRNSLSCPVEECFEDIEFVASASIGQVYKATHKVGKNKSIKNGRTKVAIKIQRPDIRDSIALDIFVLDKLSLLLDTYFSYTSKQRPFHREFMNSFIEGMWKELDYENEAKNQNFFRDEFRRRNMLDKVVVVPEVFDSVSSREVLVTEWIEGKKISEVQNSRVVQDVIPVGVTVFCTMLLDIGKFHADPHWGNLIIDNDNRLCLIDFGLCADVGVEER